MRLLLTRDAFLSSTTLGTLTVDGLAFGYTCEDEDRGLDANDPATLARKVPNETAIPVGSYRVRRTMSAKYGRVMPLICDTPGFRGVRIHAGNDEGDTAGCVLPGLRRDVAAGTVGKSKLAADWLDRRIAEVEAGGGQVWLTVERDAGAWAERS